jgi:hypothetical protein
MFKLAAAILVGLSAGTAHGATIAWTKWKHDFRGLSGSADGVIDLATGHVLVHYSGEVEHQSRMGFGRPEWRPYTTFEGGTVGNPPRRGNQITFYGGSASGVNIITFSSPVTNPVLGIYSLGAGSVRASMDFRKLSLSVESGGPTHRHGGSAPTVQDGHIVVGQEANGTVQINGTVTKIKFATPVYEVSCSFTVGVPK